MSWVNIFDNASSPANPALQSYANGIFNCSIVGANEIKRVTENDLNPQAWLSIVFEMLFFYVAFTYSEALKDMDPDGRRKVGRELAELLIPNAVDFAFEDAANGTNSELKRKFQAELTARVAEYSRKAAMIPRRAGDDPSESAVGALALRVSKLSGRPHDASILLACSSHVQDSTLLLPMESLGAVAAKIA